MKVALLHDASALDGRPDEQDALVQVESIEAALASLGHQSSRIAFGLDLGAVTRHLREQSIELAFNLVESVEGQGRLIHLAPALFDSLGLPYTGVGTEAMLLCSHKVWTKRLLGLGGLPTPPWLDSIGGEGGRPCFPDRYILKSVWEDASLGLDDDSVVHARNPEALQCALQQQGPRLGGEAFAEKWIEGREFNLALLEMQSGPTVLPIAEMCFADYPRDKPRLVGYRAKWDPDSFEYTHTVRRFGAGQQDAALLAHMETIAQRCWGILGLRGYARVDFRVDDMGRPWVLEVNPNPCLSPDAGFVSAAEQAGIDSPALVRALLLAADGARLPAMG